MTAIDRKLLALLTGEMGDNQRIARISAELGHALSVFMPDLVLNETGLKFTFGYAGYTNGMMEDLVAGLPEYMILADAGMRGWCPKFTVACPSNIIIAMVESMLGGPVEEVTVPVGRPASRIELQMCPFLFEKIGWVLKTSVELSTSHDVVMSNPYNADNRPEPDEDADNPFATEIRLAMSYGPIIAHMSMIVPQRWLLKTKVRPPKPKVVVKPSAEWSDQLSEQIRRSDVRLEARIALQPLTLGTIARLQVGDVIPFLGSGDIHVDVNANGRDLYVAEFGRAGEQYTVRIKTTHGSEDDLIKHLMG